MEKLKNIGRFYKCVQNIYKRVARPVRDKAITLTKKREFLRSVNCFVFTWMHEWAGERSEKFLADALYLAVEQSNMLYSWSNFFHYALVKFALNSFFSVFFPV